MSKANTIIITGVVTFVLTSALWVAGIAGLYWYFVASPPSFSVQIETPSEVQLEEEFLMVVTVTNPSDEDAELGSIDIYDSLLDGFEILHVLPEPTDRADYFDFHTAYFNTRLAPGESETYSYTLRAKEEGLWVGDIDCCAPNEKFVTTSKAITVSAAQ